MIRSWISGSGSVRASSASSSTKTISGTGKIERARDLAGDELGDQRLRALSRAAELQHVHALVVGFDDRGQRAAFAQRRDVAGGVDGSQADSVRRCNDANDRTPPLVIPAKAGIQLRSVAQRSWIPAFAGMTKAGAAMMCAETCTRVPHNRAMPTQNYDAILIGAGHNGLVCATYLAKAGLKVLVLERRGVVGGAAVTEEFHPGFRNSVAAYTVSLLQPKVIRDLDLEAHGLTDRAAQAQQLPAAAGRPLSRDRRRRTQAEIAKFSQRDADRLPEYERRLDAIADVLRALALEPPPNVTDAGWLKGLAGTDARGPPRQAACGDRSDAAHRSARSLRDLGGRISRPLLRERTDQGRARLRRHRRQLREPVHAGLGVRAAASRVRRGERRQGRVGPRDRRHGRDHAGDGESRAQRPASRSASARACAKSSSKTGASSASSAKRAT